MSIALGPDAAATLAGQAAWEANLDALRKTGWPHADALAAASPAALEREPLDGLPDVPSQGNILLDAGSRYDMLVELLGRLDVHQVVCVIEPDLAALAAGLRQADLSAAIARGRLVLLAGGSPVDDAVAWFRRRPLAMAPEHLLMLTADADRAATRQQWTCDLLTRLLADAVEQLARAGAQAEPYVHFSLAAAVHDREPAEPTAAAHMALALHRLGIDEPAAGLIEQVIARLGPQPELTALRDALRPGRGRVDLATRAGLFAENLAALREADAAAADVVEHAAWPAGLAVYRDANHNYQCCHLADGRTVWQPDLCDHRGSEQVVRRQVGTYGLVAPGQLVCGIGLGGVLRAAHGATAASYYEHKALIYVVEPRPWMLRLALHLWDWTDVLAGGRVRWFLGEGAERRLVDYLADHPMMAVPTHEMVSRTYHAPWRESAPQAVAELRRRFVRQIADCSGRLGRLYSARTPEQWVRIFRRMGSRPPRIMVLTTRHSTFIQHSSRDVVDAFVRLGCEARLLIEPDDVSQLTSLYISRQVEQFVPDLFVVIDHHRHEYGDCLPPHVPYVCWIQDRLDRLLSRAAAERLGPRDYTVGHCRIECCTRHGYDPRRFLALPVFTCGTRYHDAPADAALLRHFACDVSYVSHCPESNDQWFASLLVPGMPEPLRVLMRAFYDHILAEYAEGRCVYFVADLVELLGRAERACGFGATGEQDRWRLAQQFWRLNDRLFRQSALEWLIGSGLDVRLYGRGWEKHPTLAPFARGVAENGEELRAIYQASRINLQILPCGMTHQRLLDGVASGGFFLVRRHPANFAGALYRRAAEYMGRYGIGSADELEARGDPEAVELVGRLRRETELLAPAYRQGLCFILDSAREEGFRWFPDMVFEDLDAVMFDSRADLLAKAAAFLADKHRRGRIVAAMRRVVTERFGFVGGMQQVLDFLAERIAQEDPELRVES